MLAPSMIIDGIETDAPDRMPVEDPATERMIAEVPVCSPDLLDRAIEAARLAFPTWSAMPAEERRERVSGCGQALSACAAEVAALLTSEQGKPRAQADAEVALSANWFGHTANLRTPVETLVDDERTRITLERVPFGVVTAITPSNYPIILAVCKIAPALLAGNTVVVKPSPDTPLSTLAMIGACQAHLPAGVLNVVCGGADLGKRLVRHPAIRKVSFTGSVEAGQAIAREAGYGLKRVTLELGGNDPALVLPGADPATVADDLFTAAMANAGQFCAAVKRVYVPRRQQRALVDALSALAEAAKVGPGCDPQTQIGPLTTRRQLDRLAGLVEQARAAGGQVCAGGVRPAGPGHFYRPTIVSDLPDESALEREEQFGPALPVIGYDDVSEAVQRANASRFGLGASVWGEPIRAEQIARLLDAGTVWVNKHGDLRHDTPFGGVRSSGIGVEYGYLGLLEYAQVRVTNARIGY